MKKILSYILIPLWALIAVSCSDHEEAVPASEVRATFTLLSRESAAATSPASTNEMINDWWVVFANTDNEIMRIVSSSETTAVEYKEIDLEIPAGNYKVYAFANITQTEIKKATGDFAEGDPLPEGLKDATYSFKASYEEGTEVPMSGYGEITVTGATNQRFAIELVRMWAKFELQFSSATDDEITVNSVSLSPVYKGAIPLLPVYANLGKAPAERPLGDVDKDFKQTFENLTVPGNAVFYLTEGKADVSIHPSGCYFLTLGITRNDASEDISCVISELEWINRNDHIQLPIKLTNYLLELEATFYPPIGGYPDVEVENKKGQYYATFGSGGMFAINVRVREAKVGSPWLLSSEYSLAMEVTDDQSIFADTPTLDAFTGEITGELTSATGTACVRLAITPVGTDLTYYRNFYIVRAAIKP